MPLKDPNLEGFAIVEQTQKLYWDHHKKLYLNKGGGGGALNDEGHMTVWPVSICVQAVIDAARVNSNFKKLIPEVTETFLRYYSPKHHAYTASLYFDGNEDIYFDDNAQVASCFLSAYEVTQEKKYLDKAVENVNFLMTGKYHDKFGGVRWHIGKEGSNACTTAEVGIACARVARLIGNDVKQHYLEFADYCWDFIYNKLQDKDGLIADGLEPDGGSYKLNGTKWTYNQGTPLTLSGLLYEATGNEKYFESARVLAKAVTDTNTEIFDRDTQDHDKRFYRDSLNFYQLLAEGFADYLLFFGAKDEEVSQNIVKTANRHLYYIYSFLRFPDRPEYVGTLELFRIDEARYDVFKKFLGEDKKYQPSGSEREGDKAEGKLKTNPMNMGSAARTFLQSARIVPQVNF